jgi:SAM-dependent methyltransferase
MQLFCKNQASFYSKALDFPRVKLSNKNLAHLTLYSWASKTLPKGLIIDIGSEMGFGLKLLQREGRQVIGLDIDYSALNFSCEKNNSSSSTYYLCADYEQIPLPEKSVDGICLINTLHTACDPLGLLEESVRILRKDHPIIISIPTDYNLPAQWKEEGVLSHFTSILKQVFRKVEFPCSKEIFSRRPFFSWDKYTPDMVISLCYQ